MNYAKDICYFYYIKIDTGTNYFYKIGITDKRDVMNERYSGQLFTDYTYTLLIQKGFDSRIEAEKYERKIINKYRHVLKDKNSIRLFKNTGNTEIFTTDIISDKEKEFLRTEKRQYRNYADIVVTTDYPKWKARQEEIKYKREQRRKSEVEERERKRIRIKSEVVERREAEAEELKRIKWKARQEEIKYEREQRRKSEVEESERKRKRAEVEEGKKAEAEELKRIKWKARQEKIKYERESEAKSKADIKARNEAEAKRNAKMVEKGFFIYYLGLVKKAIWRS